jgi:hypothetical protein
MAFPTKDASLVDYSTNFNTRIVASPTTFSLTAGQAAAYTPLHSAFLASYNAMVAARESGTQSQSLTASKDADKVALLRYGRELYALVQASLTVSDADKILLGVTVKDNQPTPIPAPSSAPGMTVVSVDGRLVSLRLFDLDNPTSRAIPPGVDGALVMSFVGENPPAEASAYTLQGPVSRTALEVQFPVELIPGTKVWLIACWFNGRKQLGPACSPVSTVINFGGSMPMAA